MTNTNDRVSEDYLDTFTLSDKGIERFSRRTSGDRPTEWLKSWKACHNNMLLREEFVVGSECCRPSFDTMLSDYWRDLTQNAKSGGFVIPKLYEYFGQDFDTYPECWGKGMVGRNKVSKILLGYIDKMSGQDTGDVDSEYYLRSIQSVANRYCETLANIKALDGKKHRVIISVEPDAFMRLGHNKCDTGSCYKSSGCYRHSPCNLAVSSQSVVYYIKDIEQDTLLGRGWGFCYDTWWVISNVYTNNISGGRSAGVEIIKDALHQKYDSRSKSVNECRFNYEHDELYMNGDAIALKYDEVDPHFRITYHNEGGDEDDEHCCHDCGDYEEDGHYIGDIGWVCACCLGNAYIFVDGHNEYYPNDCVVYDDVCEEYILEDDAMGLYDGRTCHTDCNTVEINLGEHSGDYCMADDEDCCETDDGLVYIEGTYDEKAQTE
jgi:hypothetical protein